MSVPEGFENLGFENENLNSTSTVKSSRPVLTSSVSKDSVKTFRNKLQGTIDVWWLYDDGGKQCVVKGMQCFTKYNLNTVMYTTIF